MTRDTRAVPQVGLPRVRQDLRGVDGLAIPDSLSDNHSRSATG